MNSGPRRPPSLQHRRRCKGLSLGFYNPRGLRVKEKPNPDEEGRGSTTPLNLIRVLYDNNLDICGLGECHISKTKDRHSFQLQLDDAADLLSIPRYNIIWGCANSGPGLVKSGVAVVIRADLLGEKLEILDAEVERHKDGRLMVIKCSWGGHTFRLCVVYLPSGETKEQYEFIEGRLEAVAAAAALAQESLILMGDFNFVDNWRLDRTNAQVAEVEREQRRNINQNEAPQRWICESNWPAKRMLKLCEKYDLVDTFRSLHRGCRGYTFFSRTSAARLDRIYVSDDVFPHVLGSERIVTARKSDHLPVVLGLRSLIEESPRKKMPKAQIQFFRSAPHKEAFCSWIASQVESMQSVEGEELLAMHAELKKKIVVKTRELSFAHRKELMTPSNAQVTAALTFKEAIARVEHEGAGGEALLTLMNCRNRFTDCYVQANVDYELRGFNQKWKWIKQGERPSQWLTQCLLRSTTMRRCISALRLANGTLTRDGHMMATAVALYWQSISTAPLETLERAEAQEKILAAVKKHATQIDKSSADLAGSLSISAEAVIRIAGEMPGGTAPGSDGIPFELWRNCLPETASHLARVFAAIGGTGSTPSGFLDGILKSLYKGNESTVPPLDPTDVCNYRPITLLCTDYRLLGRILSSRMTSILSNAIPPSQTAFLPGRLMGDNILFLQLLPSALKLNASQGNTSAPRGALAFLDFRKAYDSVDRSFLLRLMSAFGVGDGMTQWYNTLLSHTSTAASVNGHTSSPVELTASIRQGAAESCGGYLPIPWALDCWLRECLAVGVKVTEMGEIRGAYYADDGAILLRSLCPNDIRMFKEAMHTFALATNQHLNLSKTKLLPVGSWSEPLPSDVEGFSVVSQVTSLGVTFSNDDEPLSPDWGDLLGNVKGKYKRVASAYLSTFGRSMAASSYGTSKLLHALEFSGPLPESTAKSHESVIRQLVDLNLPPSAPIHPQARRQRAQEDDDGTGESEPRSTMPGIHSQALFGPIGEGGFSLLPLEEHTRARWFMQVRRFVLWSIGDPLTDFTPKPLSKLHHRMAEAARKRQLYTPTVEEELLLKIKPSKPLWIDLASSILSTLYPLLHPVQSLLTASYLSIEDAATGKIGPNALPAGPLRRWCISLSALGIPVADPLPSDPSERLLHTFNLLGSPPASLERKNAVVTHISRQRWTSSVGKPVALLDNSASVKRVTLALLAPKLEWQRARRMENIGHAMSFAPSNLSPALELQGLMKRVQKVWKVQECANAWKEVAWRVQVNGVRAAGGHDISLPCSCGWSPPPPLVRPNPGTRHTAESMAAKLADEKGRALRCKAHAFGECPVAKAVFEVLRAGLPPSIQLAIKPADIWLLRLPPETPTHGMHEDVWSVVCVLALHSMARGHATLFRAYSQSGDQADAVSKASNRAVGWFCYLLNDVASSGSIPSAWKNVSADHPFLRCVTTQSVSSASPSTRLAVNLPSSLRALPADI